ncbi:Putative PAS domain, signal transduction response regulator, receiver domain, CheY-like superfamily [Colletotrichum destructivum]|uniref:histidine kinase n=1 Tax=Colletotrichum destructivum TaxID=34406 RepID=A0AAX4IDL0_9PEZI|nr:Putative PAS domain, signal transduction response regulator, receiver domain, CheY-like superfamily [Colletotrichum destructivum]
MPSTSLPADKKESSSARRLSLPRRTTSDSKKSPTKEPLLNLPSPRHGLTLDSFKLGGNARVAMSDVSKEQSSQSLTDRSRTQIEPSATKLASSSPLTNAKHSIGASQIDNDVTGGTGGTEEKSKDDKAGTTANTPPALSESQIQLNRYRERLARDLERREMATRGLLATTPEKMRVSPIIEESGNSPRNNAAALATSSSNLTTTSTESGNTIRGGITPGLVAGTPSYPFPRMHTPGYGPGSMSRAFGNMSPTAAAFMSQTMSFEGFGTAQDRVMSGSSTPASALTFLPAGATGQLEGDFPSPNLYDLSLMLTAEPGLDAWWNTVVQIMRDVYKAERVTLAVPADTTDIENVPWGQKATYNEHQEDDLSLGYMARGSSLIPSSAGDVGSEETPASEDPARPRVLSRPSLQTRHSFTTYEDNRECKGNNDRLLPSRRPTQLGRSKSYFPPGQAAEESAEAPGPSLNRSALAEHDAEEQNIPSWEVPLANPNTEGRVLPVLQALDYEADPLIDHSGVMRVLERGKVIALTRSYPYLQNLPDEVPTKSKVTASTTSAEAARRKLKKARIDSSSKLSSILGGGNSSFGSNRSHSSDKPSSMISRLDDDEPRPPTPKYEEYEQAPPSPWSQSPAPSPAVRADPSENPFFTDAMVDEDSFNPGSAPADYTGMRPPEAIGVDNSWTVLHIPLTHVLLSKPVHPFKLDNTALEQKSQFRNRSEPLETSGDEDDAGVSWQRKDKPSPIAILSILSPIIPYPSNLRHSLEYLAPHLATSFSLCRHYTNLETELTGLHRRRPQTAGFGALAADGRPLADPASIGNLSFMSSDDIAAQRSLAGSITSPSDYSGVSKSAAGSPIGTPAWDQSSLHQLIDKRGSATSPAQTAGDSYFNTRQKPISSRAETPSANSQKTRRSSKEDSPIDKRQARLSTSHKPRIQEPSQTPGENEELVERNNTESRVSTPGGAKRVLSHELKNYLDEIAVLEPRLQSVERRGGDHGHHTLLHSYGADFATSFQSLPPSASVVSKPVPHTIPSRTGSLSQGPVDMPPPSDRLKGLILDSLPAHVFVSLPQTGEIVWVNSRYLTYRGQTVADLAADPWGSIHPDDRDEYLKAWSHSLRTGEQFSRTVRIKRFDGAYRWFYARAVASRDKRGVMMQFLGSYMDIHDQHIAELKAARQEEIEASEAKHRLLANLIPQIIFTATEDEGITFANDQWLSYTGQSFEDSLGLGFMDFVHPDDLAKCQIPTDRPPTPMPSKFDRKGHQEASEAILASLASAKAQSQLETNLRGIHQALSRNNSSSSSSVYEMPSADLTALARNGIIKVTTDSNGRLSYTTEVRLRSKGGEYRWHLIRCVEIDNIDFGNGASSYFGSATDINDHKLLEAKLKEAMESKSRFLSNMSHEIRTPLIGISGMVSFLQDTTLNEEQRDYTNTIQTSANSLLMIINDILDLSKVDAGMMKLKYEWFHTRSLIEDVNELVSTMAIAKRLELNYIVEEDVPAWVKGDKVRVRQVLLNVIGNAIKFTAEGEVFSRCRVYKGGKSDNDKKEIMLEFAIIDTGRGFTKEEADLIFKPFSQIDGSSTRQHGGSGLGLVISRQLVELHGGKMEGSAIPGKGSTFTFTAKFALPTNEDHPDAPMSPETLHPPAQSAEGLTVLRPAKALQSPRAASTTSPRADSDQFLSPAPASSGSSVPSVQSSISQATERTSVSSVNVGLVHFSEAARASGQDLSQMKLELPSGESSPHTTPTPETSQQPGKDEDFKPPMYSILIICPQTHSREATAQHIEMTLPKDVPHQITALDSTEKAQRLLGGEDSVNFTHIVLNLPSPEEIIGLMEQITKSTTISNTTILILSDSVQRQAVMRLATDTKYEKLVSENIVTFIYKPVKPSRFAVIFDPDKVRDLSIDRNRSTAQRMVETQKASYQEIGKRMGNKGYKVLLVEDNPVNQKVLQKYLKKVGVDVEVAADGAECTDMVLARSHDYYSLILCDLHMPRKDGYQACREIRQWERDKGLKTLPIIALSANVMSDVQDKCVAAGFSDYVTKPVDFIDLSRAMSKFF